MYIITLYKNTVKCNENVRVIYILLMIVQIVKEKWKNDWYIW